VEKLQEWIVGLPAWQVFVGAVGIAFVLRLVLSRGVMRLARKTRTDLDDDILKAVRGPLFLTVVLLGGGLALRRLDPPPAKRALEITDAVLWSVAILYWMRGVMRVSDAILDAMARRADDYEWIQPRSLPLYEIAAKLLLLGSGVYFLLNAWDIDVTAWLASAGIVGIAVGFAAKDTLANLFAGVFILADAPYKIGDYIILDSGERGLVTQIGIRSTRILTRDDVEITIPNAVMGSAKITNETGGPHEKERIRVKVGVAYGSDIDQLERVLLDIAAGHEEICVDPKPRVRFRRFGDSSLDFELLCWITEPVLRGRLLHELHRDIYKQLAVEGIEIPYPKRDVYIKEMPAGR